MRKILRVALWVGVIAVCSVLTWADEEKAQVEQQQETMQIADGEQQETTNEVETSPQMLKYAEFQVESKTAKVQGVQHKLQKAPVLTENKVYVPIGFAAKVLLKTDYEINTKTKNITLRTIDKTILLNETTSKAYMNDKEVPFDKAITTIEGAPMISLQFIAEYYQMKLEIGNNNKTILLFAKPNADYINQLPAADFKFDQEEYSEGQPIILLDASFDADDGIKQRMWRFNNGPEKTTAQIETILKQLGPGEYQVALRVKDTRGALSDWCIQETKIKPNVKPVVTEIIPNKESYAQGEPIQLEFKYENDPWEKVEETWSYRQNGEDEKIAIPGKPNVIYAEGQYIVTLKLKDGFGQESEKKEIVLNVSSKVLERELNYKFKHMMPGELVQNFEKTNYLEYYNVSPLSKTQSSATLIMSDSPEKVSQKGILYRDFVSGEGRLLLHHINDFSEASNRADPKRLVVVAQNTTDKPIHLVIRNKTFKGPAPDILFIGQQLLVDYFKSDAYETYTLKPNQKIYLYDSKHKSWLKDTVISGKLDFSVDGQMLLSVAAVGRNTTLDYINKLDKPARDVHPRGTFSATEFYYNVELEKDKPSKLLLCKEEDEWLIGTDALTGQVVRNKGNYGVTYHINVTAKEDTGVIINPRGGVFKGAVQWGDKSIYQIPTLGVLTSKERAATLGVIKAGETVTINYVLANGSAAPVLFGFIPQSQWAK